MKYADIRSQIKTGDILGVHGTSWVSRAVEYFTGGSDPYDLSHVAVFVWQGTGLFVAQTMEGQGYSILPASQAIANFFAQKSDVFWGQAPRSVSSNPNPIVDYLNVYRATGYGYGYSTLWRVWRKLQIDPFRLETEEVCSTLAQAAWESTGYKFPGNRLMAPQDFKRFCGFSRIEA